MRAVALSSGMTGYSAVAITPAPTPLTFEKLPTGTAKSPSRPRKSFSCAEERRLRVEERLLSARAEPAKQNKAASAIVVSVFISIFSWSESGALRAHALARLVVQ